MYGKVIFIVSRWFWLWSFLWTFWVYFLVFRSNLFDVLWKKSSNGRFIIAVYTYTLIYTVYVFYTYFTFLSMRIFINTCICICIVYVYMYINTQIKKGFCTSVIERFLIKFQVIYLPMQSYIYTYKYVDTRYYIIFIDLLQIY